MARLPRLIVPQQPHHIFQGGIDRRPVFRDSDDYAVFLAWLQQAARQFKVAVHAYVLMPAHVQLLATPSDATGLGRMMQWVGRHYVPYFNQKYERAGTLWEGRYRATVIEAESYFRMCSLYIELAPLRAGLATTAADYPWSSLPHHLGMHLDPMITDHPEYWALGNTPFDREVAYRRLLEQGLSTREMALMDEATLKGWPLGSAKFKSALSKQVNRRVEPARRGRPRKAAVPAPVPVD